MPTRNILIAPAQAPAISINRGESLWHSQRVLTMD